ncbi:MAG: hypothetical protein HWE24_01620 [Oceanospirillaceae bacterium]|nr:hypothetical protein [Oceanospirillaceae bacterium]
MNKKKPEEVNPLTQVNLNKTLSAQAQVCKPIEPIETQKVYIQSKLPEIVNSKKLDAYIDGYIIPRIMAELLWSETVADTICEITNAMEFLKTEVSNELAARITTVHFTADSNKEIALKLTLHILGFAIKTAFSVSITPLVDTLMRKKLDNLDGPWIGSYLESYSAEMNDDGSIEQNNKKWAAYGDDWNKIREANCNEILKDYQQALTVNATNDVYGEIHNKVGNAILNRGVDGTTKARATDAEQGEENNVKRNVKVEDEIKKVIKNWIEKNFKEIINEEGRLRQDSRGDSQIDDTNKEEDHHHMIRMECSQWAQSKILNEIRNLKRRDINKTKMKLKKFQRTNLSQKLMWEFYRINIEKLVKKKEGCLVMEARMSSDMTKLMMRHTHKHTKWLLLTSDELESTTNNNKKLHETTTDDLQQSIKHLKKCGLTRMSDLTQLFWTDIVNFIKKTGQASQILKQNLNWLMSPECVTPYEIKYVLREKHTTNTETDPIWLKLMYVQYAYSVSKYITVDENQDDNQKGDSELIDHLIHNLNNHDENLIRHFTPTWQPDTQTKPNEK